MIQQIYGIDQDRIYWRNVLSLFLAEATISVLAFIGTHINQSFSEGNYTLIELFLPSIILYILIWGSFFICIRLLKTQNLLIYLLFIAPFSFVIVLISRQLGGSENLVLSNLDTWLPFVLRYMAMVVFYWLSGKVGMRRYSAVLWVTVISTVIGSLSFILLHNFANRDIFHRKLAYQMEINYFPFLIDELLGFAVGPLFFVLLLWIFDLLLQVKKRGLWKTE